MKKLLLTILCSTITANSIACNLQFEIPARPTIYDLGNFNIDGLKGNTEFHHIIPQQQFIAQINGIFDHQDVAADNQTSQQLRNILTLMAEQLDVDKPGDVPFTHNQAWRHSITAVRRILEGLAEGHDIDGQIVNGQGTNCVIDDEPHRTSAIISYLPADGFIGPQHLLGDPGDSFDTYGSLFRDPATYNAIVAFSQGQNTIQNFIVMLGQRSAPYYPGLWMRTASNICYISPINHQCQPRPQALELKQLACINPEN